MFTWDYHKNVNYYKGVQALVLIRVLSDVEVFY